MTRFYLLLAQTRVAQQVQLDEEQLLELLAVGGAAQRLGALRKVQVADGLRPRYQTEALDEAVGQRLIQALGGPLVEQRLHQTFDASAVHARLLHLVRRVVVRLQTHSIQLQRVGWIQVGMRNIDAPVEDSGTAEGNIFLAYQIVLLNPLESP